MVGVKVTVAAVAAWKAFGAGGERRWSNGGFGGNLRSWGLVGEGGMGLRLDDAEPSITGMVELSHNQK